MKKIIFPLIILIAVFGIIFIFQENEELKEEEKEVKVITSFYPLFELAEKIGGERVEASYIVPPGADPHEFEPSLREIAEIENANLFLYNGAGLEPWSEKVEENLQGKDVKIINMSSLFDLLKGDDHHHEHDDEKHHHHKHNDNDDHHHHHHKEDPHFWLDPVKFQKMGEKIFEEFIKLDPEGEEYYKKNKENVISSLKKLDKDYKEGLSDCRLERVVISHASLGYLEKRYNFKMEAVSGISPMEEPSPQEMAKIADIVKEENIPYIFAETTIPTEISQTIAKEAGAEILTFNPIASPTKEEIEEGASYISLMKENLEKLKKALDCK